jgi:hypothetical protein
LAEAVLRKKLPRWDSNIVLSSWEHVGLRLISCLSRSAAHA